MTYGRTLCLFLVAAAAACSESSSIECPIGYAGADCTACGVGYQDNNDDGTCLPTCDTAANQGFACERGTCSDTAGWPTCACEPGYGGEGCTACDTGYQDNDSNMTCAPSCATAEALGFGCVNGTCNDASGTPTCACDVNYAGALCDTCGPNSVRNDAGTCVGTFASCAEIKAAIPSATNGFYKLHVAKNPLRPWLAYCHDMATTPKEYLQLPPNNTGVYLASANNGTSVRTTYERVRIDPVTLEVNVSDQTFASSTGATTHGGSPVTSMPLGVAMSCSGLLALATIDLSGTPFRINETFCNGGSGSTGTATVSSSSQFVSVTGGGSCGWTAPTVGANCPFNPFNTTVGAALQLAYNP